MIHYVIKIRHDLRVFYVFNKFLSKLIYIIWGIYYVYYSSKKGDCFAEMVYP